MSDHIVLPRATVEQVRDDLSIHERIQRIPLTIICTLNDARTPGVLVAVMVEHLDDLERELADAYTTIAALERKLREDELEALRAGEDE